MIPIEKTAEKNDGVNPSESLRFASGLAGALTGMRGAESKKGSGGGDRQNKNEDSDIVGASPAKTRWSRSGGRQGHAHACIGEHRALSREKSQRLRCAGNFERAAQRGDLRVPCAENGDFGKSGAWTGVLYQDAKLIEGNASATGALNDNFSALEADNQRAAFTAELGKGVRGKSHALVRGDGKQEIGFGSVSERGRCYRDSNRWKTQSR